MAEYVTRNLIYTGVIAVMALAAKFGANIVINLFLKKIDDGDPSIESTLEKRSKTLAGLIQNVANVLIMGSMTIMVISQWGIDIAPILTGAGILGLAVGFGTQTLVRDIVTGFFILLENQYNVGDMVKIAGIDGTIKEISLRTTTLAGLDGEIHIIPNSQIAIITKLKKNTERVN